MKEYITKEEMNHCNQVKEIFYELMEESEEFIVVDAYPYGCLVLECFIPQQGFEVQKYFTDASTLFDYLLELWESIYMCKIRSELGKGDIELQRFIDIMPEPQKDEMNQIRQEYIMRYESCCIAW